MGGGSQLLRKRLIFLELALVSIPPRTSSRHQIQEKLLFKEE